MKVYESHNGNIRKFIKSHNNAQYLATYNTKPLQSFCLGEDINFCIYIHSVNASYIKPLISAIAFCVCKKLR